MHENDKPVEDRLLTPAEVARLFRVDPKTVTRWALAGRIGSIVTPGGHRRFRESEIRVLLQDPGAGSSGKTGAGPGGSHERRPVASRGR